MMRSTVALLIVLVLAPFPALAGDVDSPAPPDDPASAMFTLEAIFERLETGAPGVKRGEGFVEPLAAPGATGYTLDEVMSMCPAADNGSGALPAEVLAGKTYWGLRTDGTWGPQAGTGGPFAHIALVEKTGQTTSYASADDGDLQRGVSWPSPRFTDNGDGTVTDNWTGLIWLQDANCFGTKNWSTALTDANTLAFGSCGLSDSSIAGDWRLPNVEELYSLIDYGSEGPALSAGHPFSGVQSTNYWSSTSYAADPTTSAWAVRLDLGFVLRFGKTSTRFVWPVREGQ